ncbi:MAG: phosphatidylserine/phosphatidylglycerophosphate/cardiolipin synthase family protein [Sphingomonas sp.]|nr:phosphatidylserine/phosphatidylglycerophosphate/cardiolipin synthase family protein [Sphingomonas sp.]
MADEPKSAKAATGRIDATVDGNRLLPLETGAERMDALLDLINGAQQSLRIIFYIFASDEAGTTVRNALVQAARRGVIVRLLLDGYGSSHTSADFFRPIADEGGDFCLFEPSYGRRYLIRNHQKLVIADESRAIIGGANVETTYLTDTGEKHWRDLWIRIEGPAVRPASRYFDSLYLWTTTKGAKLRTLRRIVGRHSQSEGLLQWKFSGPLSRKNRLPAALARELTTAKRLDLIAAYFSPPWSFMRRLGWIARRGKARVITAALSDNNATIAAARHTYARLLRRGVQMFEYRAAKLHTKLAIVDDVVHVGSANLDFRSLFINMEIVLRVDDPAFASAMRGYFEHELHRCEHITPALHRRRATLWRRLKWTISYWLVTSMDYTVTRRLNFIER